MNFIINDIRESNSFLNLVIDNISSAVFIANSEVRIISFNDTFSKLFDKDCLDIKDQLCGNAIGCIYLETADKNCGTTPFCAECELRGAIKKAVNSFHKTEKFIIERNYNIEKKVVMKYFYFSVRPVTFENKNYAVVIVDDLTELESKKRLLDKQNRELLELSEQKNHFLGMAAHDLRNPISSIKTFLQFIIENRNTIPDEKFLKFMKIALNASEISLNLLNELLDITVLESGTIPLTKNVFQPHILITEIINRNLLFVEKKNIILQVAECTMCSINADRNKIDQVINNLLTNAVKYSPANSEISINYRQDNDKFTFSISDNGKGIPESDKNKIFHPFGKSKIKTTGGETSTGLGLSISKKIIEEHGGKIYFESTEGKGSVFTFEIPV